MIVNYALALHTQIGFDGWEGGREIYVRRTTHNKCRAACFERYLLIPTTIYHHIYNQTYAPHMNGFWFRDGVSVIEFQYWYTGKSGCILSISNIGLANKNTMFE